MAGKEPASTPSTTSFDRDKAQWPLAFTVKPPLPGTAPRQYWRHSDYRGPENEVVKVLYSKTKWQSEKIAQQFIDEPVLGFDIEWPWDSDKLPALKDKVALIQLACERKVALFHISLHHGTTTDELIAPSLKKIIESPDIMKTGVGVLHTDFRRLRTHFELEPKGAFELSHLHNLITYGRTTPRRATTRLCSLSNQAERHLGQPLWKGGVRTSNWSLALSWSQTQYAATDAYASFMLFHCMNAKRLAMDPVPPLPRLAETYLTQVGPKSTLLRLESVSEDGEVTIVPVDEFFSAASSQQENEVTEGIGAEGSNTAADLNAANNVSQELGGGASQGRPAEGQQANPPASSASQSQMDKVPVVEYTKAEYERAKAKSKDREKPRKASKPKPKKSNVQGPMDSAYWELLGRLKRGRMQLAGAKGVDAFQVAHDTVLVALAHQRPSSEEELLAVHGIGKVKAADYGAAWLDTIACFQAEWKQRGERGGEGRGAPRAMMGPGLEEPQEGRDAKRRIIERGGGPGAVLVPAAAPATAAVVARPPASSPLPFVKPGPNYSYRVLLAAQQNGPGYRDDDSAFGPPMDLPSPSVLKRKRNMDF
ncbi:hypothetical protein F4777DRAFT_512297 [Nemania sp. FL0916]|nr:hypothetical protein F4777DRAFT_512297 [Nemania sp. FL0916]